jgi:hypothetical protein
MKEVTQLVTKSGEPVFIVLSAMSGTTNSLVEISDYLYKKNPDGANEVINRLEQKYAKHVEELYSTDEEILIVVDGKMMLRPVFNYVIEEVKMYVMNSFELRAAGLQHWNFDDTGYWDEGLGHYVAQSNMEIYEDSIYANDMESLFGLFHIVAMDANGNRRVIEARELTVDLGDYEAEEGWYQISVSYGTFTRIIDVVVLPARNA